jgi:integrase/uncharacterized small protein (DUF1192 family)
MIKLNFSTRVFVKSNNQVAIRVRWNNKMNEVTFITGVYAETGKWDEDMQKAKKGTTHHIRKMAFTATEINERIAEFREEIENAFDKCSLKNSVPTTSELKVMVNKNLGRDEENIEMKIVHKKTFSEMFDCFLRSCELEKNWDKICEQKYNQAFHHITSAVPNIKISDITLDTMLKLKKWYINNGYKNRTVNKQINMLKCFLRWINQQEGYTIADNVLNFKTNLKVMPKTVTYLRYDELIHFSTFAFEGNNPKLTLARDLWCFMAFTSLRYSDLKALRTAHISDNRIDMMTQKTSDHISIPLIDSAIAILEKYKGKETKDGHVFNVTWNQELNNTIKEAAKEAGIDRDIIDTYYVGTQRKEEQHKFYDIISCHDARRTFVSCSLAMGIPPQVVMKCTGHKCYNTMKPYIETAVETQCHEMEKWNKSKYRSQIITLLDEANEDMLGSILDDVRNMVRTI